MDWPTYTKEQETAMELAMKLREYCKENNIYNEKDRILCGVAIHGDSLKKMSYNKGVLDERKRLKEKLGI